MTATLQHLKKFELALLAEKLKIKHPAKLNKPALVALIQEHLRALKEPLDVLEYPELSEYYDSAGESEGETDAEISGEEDGDESGEDADSAGEQEGESGLQWFSKLRFDKMRPASSQFSFQFHELLTDVQSNIADVNESIQDTLSTIPAISAIFYALEAYMYIIQPFFSFDWSRRPYFVHCTLSHTQLISLLAFWGTFSFCVPAVAAYYINFIRYDLPQVEIDPLVFHVTKSLLALFVGHYWRPGLVSEATYVVKDSFGRAKFSELIRHGLAFAQLQWALNLQQWPLIFGITGVILCLYVL
ncbi:AEL051Wp [Eremothecium gossypii ATCC 10895]|uniref:AEL051Wp n=1 Tax=Eremothecium gossypii (strain ATCC 10895 / CBS 109.51 / FGSC 9923 / NRRL Y-1056) TaxID=284811 RepID=Q757R3_EREGS|nr:AEL051Wp [Eremothecium gossypii ATCC 10895]AAS52634.1 AEL051Wp [Eremothecium gossypii ATCC 10895]AEY96939.1 FAEL051Wp [Eremothecium gossypii FDAG1]